MGMSRWRKRAVGTAATGEGKRAGSLLGMGAALLAGLAAPALAQTAGTALQNPPEFRAWEGPVLLEFKESSATVGGLATGPLTIQTRLFANTGSSALVGPTIRARPGDKLVINLKNSMKFSVANGDAFMSDTIPHGFGVVNMHVHGLHVSPKDNSDNVLLNLYPAGLSPQEKALCEQATHHDAVHKHVCAYGDWKMVVEIPKDHPTGTFWYHPHKHGAVSLHLASGLAGALIIEGAPDDKQALDNVPAVKAARQRVLVLQELVYGTYDPKNPNTSTRVDCVMVYGQSSCVYPAWPPMPPNGGVTPAHGAGHGHGAAAPAPAAASTAAASGTQTTLPSANQKLSVNGQFNPVIDMYTNESQYWRVVNATVGNVVPMCLVPAPNTPPTAAAPPSLYVLGADGIPVFRPVGNMADLPFQLVPAIYDLDATGPFTKGTPGSNIINNEFLFLAAGQRLDVMVKAPPTPGTYLLLQPNPNPTETQAAPSTMVTDACPTLTSAPADVQVVAIVNVTTPPQGVKPAPSTALPTQAELNGLRRPVSVADAADVPKAPTQGVSFGFTSGEFAESTGFASIVNGRPFNAERVQRKIKIGQADRWSVQSAADTHMFHIHVNPFQIVQRGSVKYDFPIWRDTALINCAPTAIYGTNNNCASPFTLTKQGGAADNYGEVLQFVSRATVFDGPIVMHCHNVIHEDSGMMELVELVK